MLANPKVKKLLVGLIIVVVGYMFVLPRFQASEATLEIPEHANPGPTYTLESQVFNLSTPLQEQRRYLKLQVAFEFEAEDVAFFLLAGEPLALQLEHFAEELGPKRPVIDDAVGTIVSGKSLEDVTTTAGREQLREELRAAVGAIVGEPPLINVYFTEFVTQ